LVHESNSAKPIKRIEVVVGAALLTVVCCIKIVWWHDWLSLAMGVAFGLLVALAGHAIHTVYKRKQ
jgi:hypothetical protein